MRAIIPSLAVAGLALAAPAIAQTPKASPARMSAIVKTIASPPFQGRSPGTEGENRTVDYLIKQMKALGLQPAGPDGQWTQKVPMIRTQINPDGKLSITGTQAIALKQGDNINLTTVRPDKLVTIKNAPMVFVGYGVDAPEANWDDFKNVDVAGKVVVFLVNDPDFKAVKGEDAYGRFGGRRMTYYGRWTYKFEEAARRGAAAALIIHDTDAAGYGWQTVSASNGENYDILHGPDARTIPLQGWIRGDLAKRMFAAAGLDLAKLRVEARSASFHPVELKGLRFNADLPVTVHHIESRNVIGKIAGKTHPDEAIMIGAHWDAYGIGKPDAQGRTMRPGANDDGLGIAGVLELARMFKASPEPDRTLLFAAWTGEERGLLGSEYYAEHPYIPLAKTVADLNMDILQTAGPAKNVVLVGKGNSTLDKDLEEAAATQGRTVVPETFTERGLFFRADHFSVARRGVPSLLIMALGGPPDLRQGGLKAGQAWLDDYMKCYHQTCDSWSKDWDLRGAAQDVDLLYDVGEKLADSRQWPKWRPDFAFAKIRAKTADQRQ
ncbi:M28 family metallopeptidase [Stakelama sediminis]|uniref:Zn-dependent M28 family amino/carboxypeptidase n=1 Tax=Stakelama sediminis TaxID=463200 RepID=A0A840YYS0_9SPHN|nr:M28 family metallopeptidase [Stakelama sediminis]MBB5718664.1 Zn-dependent M28 family amino/carboxypeptidase [Stakelama sediminis]